MQYFISDLHLCATRPETTAAWRRFMAGPARQVDALWILGDLFEYWAGDDDVSSEFNTEIAADITALVQYGVNTHILVGNRDFLLGQEFARLTGAVLETEPLQLDLYGTPTLLMHGDALCTDDLAYQQFRTMVRNPDWQAQFLAQPLPVRRKIAEQLRMQSEMKKGDAPAAIMDVNPNAVAHVLQQHGATRLIHGHTHLPARHDLNIAGRTCERWVLSDWHNIATWLEASEKGLFGRTA